MLYMTISVGLSADEAQPLVAIRDQGLIQSVLTELARPGRWYEPETIPARRISEQRDEQGAKKESKEGGNNAH